MSNSNEPIQGHGNMPVNHVSVARGLSIRSAGALSTELNTSAEDEFNIDLLGLWHILLKRRWTIAATIGLCFVLALVVSLLITPVYRATSSVQIDRELMNVTTNDAGPVTDYWMDPDYINTQYQILQSREMAERVLNDLGYQDEKRFNQVFLPSTASQIKSWFGAGNTTDKNKRAENGQLAVENEKKAAIGRVAKFSKGFAIEPIRNTRIVKIHYNSTDPAFAIKAVNGLAEAFQNRNLETRFETSAYAKSYLEDQLKQLKIRLEDSEAQLVRVAEKEQIVGSVESSGSLPEQNLGALNGALAKATEERIRAESRWRVAQASGNGLVTMTQLSGSGLAAAIGEDRARKSAEYQDKLRMYKPDYPLMQQLKAQIDSLDKQIAIEVGNIKSTIRAEYEAALQNETEIIGQIKLLKGEALDLQSRSIQYNILKRDVDTNRQLYDATLERYKEIGVAAGVGLNNILVVDKAVNAGKFNPNIPLNLAISLFLGAVLGVLLALLLEYLDDTLKNPEDVEKILKLPILGVIPKLAANMTLDGAYSDVRSAFSEAYRSVRTSLQFSTNHGVPRTLLITSSSPGEGKSTAALTLARNFSQIGKRVLLIDADMRKPSLHKKMLIDNGLGLSNYLAGAVNIDDVLYATDIAGLSVIPTGPLPPNPAELLHDDNMHRLLAFGLAEFDMVIIDGPPVMGLADAPILASRMDGVVLVVEAGVTRKGFAKNAVKRLQSAHAHLVGVLINKFEAKHASYGYGYGYGHAGYNYYSYGVEDNKKLTK
ncbi:MAG TPA: polysaccharide biosynthesis tyrosine autokinase [Arenimonas sp.]|nr:polysaccharide biosynthesis tyrosine autokinase [Arenimonas sp.]